MAVDVHEKARNRAEQWETKQACSPHAGCSVPPLPNFLQSLSRTHFHYTTHLLITSKHTSPADSLISNGSPLRHSQESYTKEKGWSDLTLHLNTKSEWDLGILSLPRGLLQEKEGCWEGNINRNCSNVIEYEYC